MKKSYDFVFIGGRLAANTHARYFKLKYPHLKILVLEKSAEANWSPGESTVGVAATFLIKDLGLSTYCYLNHLPKNGLRYFFGTEEAKSIDQCSEIGSNMLPIIPTFQLDRKKIDEDLWVLNSEIGIETLTSAEVNNLSISRDGGLHTIEYHYQGSDHAVECEWVIHSSGRKPQAFQVFNQLSPLHINEDHQTAAAWGRFKNVSDIDLMGDKNWKRRAGYTARYLSTIHFMIKGAWVWFIPIGDGIVSVGVVYDKNVFPHKVQEKEGFLSFLNDENTLGELMKNADMLDFQSFDHLSFKRDSFCGKEKWAIIGDSYAFVDPFYSPGSDVIARQAHLLNVLYESKDQSEFEKNVELINRFSDYDYDLLKYLYQDQYGGFGSFLTYNIKSFWDFYVYTIVSVSDFLGENYLDKKWLKSQLENKDFTLGILKSVQNGFIELTKYLEANNRYSEKNLFEYSLRQNRFKIEEDMLEFDLDSATKASKMLMITRLVIAEMLSIRFDLKKLEKNPDFINNLEWEDILSFRLEEKWLCRFLDKVSTKIDKTIDSEVLRNGSSRHFDFYSKL